MPRRSAREDQSLSGYSSVATVELAKRPVPKSKSKASREKPPSSNHDIDLRKESIVYQTVIGTEERAYMISFEPMHLQKSNDISCFFLGGEKHVDLRELHSGLGAE